MKNLLIISSGYPHENERVLSIFVHSQVEELKKLFDKIVVISTTPYIPKVLGKWVKPKHRKDSMAEDYSYDNVDVYFTKNIVLPIGILKKYRGDQEYKRSKEILERIGFKPDIIHSHFSWPSGYAAVKLKRDLNVPVVITIHENHDWFVLEEKDKRIIETWKNADALIRVNKLDLPTLRKYNNGSVSIPNGYLHNKFKPMDQNKCKKQLDLEPEKKIIFSLGQIVERKGFQDLINAANILRKKRTDFQIIIGGNGPYKENLENLIKKMKLGEYINLIGFVEDKNVPKYMNAAEFFVLPSYSEGNPTVMFECLGCGKPFIGTNVGGIPEIIINEDLGMLIEPGDVKRLARALESGMDKDWNKEQLLEYARQFTWKNIVSQVMEIYHEII